MNKKKVICSFNPDSMRTTATEFDRELEELRELYPPGVAYVSQNLFGSHDANRIGSHIVNRGFEDFRNWGTYFGASKALENPDYSTRKPTEEDLVLQKLFVIMQMTYVGAPMVYYGDELGMWGSNDPDCRKPMIWDDVEYEDEVFNVDQSKHEADKVEINRGLLDHYKKLIRIRNNNPALQYGTYKTLLADNEKDLFIFERTLEGVSLIVVINNSDQTRTIELSELQGNCYEDLISGAEFKAADNIKVEKKWGLILVGCL